MLLEDQVNVEREANVKHESEQRSKMRSAYLAHRILPATTAAWRSSRLCEYAVIVAIDLHVSQFNLLSIYSLNYAMRIRPFYDCLNVAP